MIEICGSEYIGWNYRDPRFKCKFAQSLSPLKYYGMFAWLGSEDLCDPAGQYVQISGVSGWHGVNFALCEKLTMSVIKIGLKIGWQLLITSVHQQ